ncbi:MAG: protein kinase [Steroidobacteraceae bacterium]
MGAVLYVEARPPYPFQVVLKYCRETSGEQVQRFRRETRLLASYAGNGKIVNVVHSNSDHDPPYVVMQYYPGGDLGKAASLIRSSDQNLENAILQMIDGLAELHARGHFHRDIKPQNFLIDGQNILVSDFGLTTEVGSETAFTRSSVWWGTYGYIPPEFLDGGFKNADAAGDIFMLGKTIFAISTGKDPLYLVAGGLHAPLYHVIERCCSFNKGQRYQSLAHLRQAVVAAFDVILGRGGGVGMVKQILSSIEDRLRQEQRYDPQQVGQFAEQLALLNPADKTRVCLELPQQIFSVFSQAEVKQHVDEFLAVYSEMVEEQSYGWSYAEKIASNMKVIFKSADADPHTKGMALDIAIRASIYMNRYAAMDVCTDLIREVTQEPLGSIVASVIARHSGSFVDNIEVVTCKNQAVVGAIMANKAIASTL